jgi:ATP-dependent RNA helicase SUPV3L1/SUV3
MKQLDQEARAQLRKYGVRFGAFNIHFPLLLKPASSELLLLLWAIWQGDRETNGLEGQPDQPRPGLTSVPAQAGVPETFYRVAGYHLCGPRAVRIDMLERLADMIRPLIAWRPNEASPAAPPKGASADGGFTILPEMLSILGCNSAELGEVLKALGFRLDRKPVPPEPVEATATAEPAEPPVMPAADAAMLPAVEEETAPAAETIAAEPIFEAESPVVEAPAEPQFIDVWRPRRRYDESRREQAQRPRRRHQPRQEPQSPVATEPSADAGAAERKPEGGAQDRPPRHGQRPRRRSHDGPRQDRPTAAEAPAQATAPRPERSDRGQKRPDRPREERRQVFDPNSPFAALSALKEKLEAGGRKPESSS